MNDDHVAIKQEVECSWNFVIPSDTTLCAESLDELSTIIDELFTCFGDFVVPLEAEFKRQVFPRDSHVPVSEKGDPDSRLDLRELTVSDEAGITPADIVETFEFDGAGDVYVFEIRIDRTRVKMELESGDRYVDRTGGCVWYNGTSRIDRQPRYDPLYFVITHLPNVDDDELDADFQFLVRVKTKSNIWFQESELGEANRARLSAFLARIDDTLPVAKVIRNTDWNTTDPLEAVF